MDYSIFYKKNYNNLNEFNRDNDWDIFVSSYNDSDRVKKVFKKAKSKIKHWLILPEYKYSKREYPLHNNIFDFNNLNSESEIIISYMNEKLDLFKNSQICVDITGFMRPHLIFLLIFFQLNKITKFDIIYTDPVAYVKAEKTTFTKTSVLEVRQIAGCEGSHSTDNSNDLLIIGSGYDHKLITQVAESKEYSRKVQLFGFPSLQPDMFQENLLNAFKAEESFGGFKFIEKYNTLFAPANDPFITATILSQFISKENNKNKITNLYLSPLSTKAQTLGFGLFYLWECTKKPVSIIFPFSNEYSRETTTGIKKIWKYTVELPTK